MNTKVFLSFLLSVPLAVQAGEHPKEHPEHPKPAAAPAAKPAAAKHEHPEDNAAPQAGSPEWVKRMTREYTKAVESHIKTAGPTGSLTVPDDKLKKDWGLKLKRLHKDKVVSLGGNRFFACADFKDAAKGSKDTVDLDFYAMKADDGSWKIERVLIHKVNGAPRYTYNDKNEMVPAR